MRGERPVFLVYLCGNSEFPAAIDACEKELIRTIISIRIGRHLKKM